MHRRLSRSFHVLAAVGLATAVGAGCDVKTRPNAEQISAAQATPLGYPHQFVVMGDSRIPGVAVFQALLSRRSLPMARFRPAHASSVSIAIATQASVKETTGRPAAPRATLGSVSAAW